MKKLLYLLPALAMSAVVTSASTPARNPGVVFEMATTTGASATPQTFEVRIEGVNVHMTGIGGNEAIYRGDRRELIVIDNEQRSYMVMDEATIKRLMAQVSQVMGQMQDMLKNMPESQRAAMEEMMRGRGMAMGADRPTIEIRATGQTGTRGKYAVRQFEVLTDGRKTQELWATNWSNIDGYQEARPVMEDMANYFKALTEGMPSASQDASQELMSYMSEIDGFPVATTMFDASGSPTGGSELKGTRRETLSASEFEPPAGYRQQALPGMQ